MSSIPYRHDTWATGLASKLLGLHDGWDKISPLFNGVEIHTNYPAVYHARGDFEKAMQSQSEFFLGKGDITWHQLIKGADDEGLDVLVCADAHMENPYHGNPTGLSAQNYYAQYLDPDAYALWCLYILQTYPFIKWLQIFNEPNHQRGPNLPTSRYTEIVLAVELTTRVHRNRTGQKLMAGPFEEWTHNTFLEKVVLSKHELILHNLRNPETYANTMRELCVGHRQRHPAREIWIDETLPVGRFPGGTTVTAGAEFYDAGLDSFQDCHNVLDIAGFGLGFSGGLEPPCNSRWKICSGLIDQHGNLTLGGIQALKTAHELGWTANKPPVIQPPPQGDTALDRLDADIEYFDEIDAMLPGGDIRKRWRKQNRRFYKDVRNEIRDSGDGASVGSSPPTVPTTNTDSMLERFLKLRKCAIRLESDGTWADWRDTSNEPHHDKVSKLVSPVAFETAVRHLESKLA